MDVSVLIETYWNVNLQKQIEEISKKQSINRNILECKCKIVDNIARNKQVLIETYWNVNSLNRNPLSTLPIVLIETYWNVNVFSSVSTG